MNFDYFFLFLEFEFEYFSPRTVELFWDPLTQEGGPLNSPLFVHLFVFPFV